MNHAEKLKELDTLRAQVPELRGKVQRMDHILREKDVEIDRLRSDAIRTLAAGGVLVRLGRSDDYADVCDDLVFTDAMAGCTWPAYELLVPKPKGDKT